MDGLVGPTFGDLDAIDFSGDRSVIATAFYSFSAMNKISVSSQRLDLLVRLDMDSCREWKHGVIDPVGLSNFVKRHLVSGTDTRLFIHPIAHAKAYVGRSKLLIGSANLTVRGFSGVGHEMLWRDGGSSRRKNVLSSLDSYRSNFTEITQSVLDNYIFQNQDAVLAYRQANPIKFRRSDENRVDSASKRATRYGDYEAFKSWVAKQPGDAAATILRRANGEGSLSGHIRANFFGIRQWMIFDPDIQKLGRGNNPQDYRLLKDSAEAASLKEFVENNSADEPGFSLYTWKGYLPKELGGRAKNYGGTIGNLHRMLPLIARYLP